MPPKHSRSLYRPRPSKTIQLAGHPSTRVLDNAFSLMCGLRTPVLFSASMRTDKSDNLSFEVPFDWLDVPSLPIPGTIAPAGSYSSLASRHFPRNSLASLAQRQPFVP